MRIRPIQQFLFASGHMFVANASSEAVVMMAKVAPGASAAHAELAKACVPWVEIAAKQALVSVFTVKPEGQVTGPP
jgi:hypothetical protein